MFFAACLLFNQTVRLTEVRPSDTYVRYVGRFDARDPVGPKCAWSASAIELRFRGSSIQASFNETGQDWIQVFVDGAASKSLALAKGTSTVTLAEGMQGKEHVIRVVKRTEPFVGTFQFLGFKIADGAALRPVTRSRRIEVIGDSITCGFGNLGQTVNDRFLAETEDATRAYGFLAAEELKADLVSIAWSGKKLWPDNDIPSIYDLSNPSDPTSKWTEGQQIPNAVVINLGTNDFGRENPDEKGWTNAYKAFIAHLRRNYPKSIIYVAIGSMMTDTYPAGHMALSTIRGYANSVVTDLTKAGDKNVKFLEFEVQNLALDGGGSAYHPNVKTHQKMAARLVGAIRRDLGWK